MGWPKSRPEGRLEYVNNIGTIWEKGFSMGEKRFVNFYFM